MSCKTKHGLILLGNIYMILCSEWLEVAVSLIGDSVVKTN